jgi:hypothetical protein
MQETRYSMRKGRNAHTVVTKVNSPSFIQDTFR